MIGSYITTEQDVLLKREVPKPIGMGSYAMDSHNVQRYITPQGFVQNEVSATGSYHGFLQNAFSICIHKHTYWLHSRWHETFLPSATPQQGTSALLKRVDHRVEPVQCLLQPDRRLAQMTALRRQCPLAPPASMKRAFCRSRCDGSKSAGSIGVEVF